VKPLKGTASQAAEIDTSFQEEIKKDCRQTKIYLAYVYNLTRRLKFAPVF